MKRIGSVITAMTLLITSFAANNEYFKKINLNTEAIGIEDYKQDYSEEFAVNSENIFIADIGLLNLSFEEVKERLGMDLSEPQEFPYWGVDLKNIDIVYNEIPVCLMFQYDKLVMMMYDTYSELTDDVLNAASDVRGESSESNYWTIENGYFEISEDYYESQQTYGYRQSYVSSEIVTTLMGDVTCDDIVDVRDVTLLNQYIVKMSDLSIEALVNADVIVDGNVDLKDLGQLKKFIIKVIDKF